MAATKHTDDLNHLGPQTPAEWGYVKARVRYLLGKRPSQPFGSNEGLSPERRGELDRAVRHMLRGIQVAA